MKKLWTKILTLTATLPLMSVQVLAAGNQSLPATGDESPILPVIILMLLSAMGIVVMLLLAKSSGRK